MTLIAAAPTKTAYHAYGMTVLSDIPLPELSSAIEADDRDATVIRLGSVALPEGMRDQAVWYDFAQDSTTLHWSSAGSFHVADKGRSITVQMASDVSEDLIAFPLLGPVLSECLRHRGLFVLHASSVALDGFAVALMADKGTGKSTTASALLESGGQLLADDLVALDTANLMVVPGFGQMKLSEAAFDRLQLTDAVARPHVHDAINKLRVMVPGHFSTQPVPLGRGYVLERDPEAEVPRIETIAPNDLLPLMLPHAYAGRFGRNVLKGAAGATYFRNAVALCQSGLVRRLVVPSNLARVGEIVAAIRSDLATIPRGAPPGSAAP
jgi:hypothetical protein